MDTISTSDPVEVAPAPGADLGPGRPAEGLRARAARGTLINASFSAGLHTLGFLKSFVIAAFLTTSEYGIWGILVISLGTLGWLKDLGIDDKFVQQDEGDQEKAFQKAFTLEAIANGLLLVISLVALPLFALAYGQWEIVLPGIVLLATLPARAMLAPTWVFQRQLRFAKQRLLMAVDPIVALVVTVPLAVGGFGYWSLVIGFFAGMWAAGIVAALVSPYRLAFRWEGATTREYFRFSWPLLVSNVSMILIPQVTMLVGEAKLGLAGAGVLALAGSIATYADKVDAIITETLYPAICRVKDRTDLLFEAFVKSNRLDLMWGVPFGVALTLFAEDLVQFGIGEKWEPAVGLIQAYGLISAANHIGYNWTAFFRARGRTTVFATGTLVVLAAFLCVTIPLLVLFELDGFAAGMAFMIFVSLCVRAHYVRQLFPGYSMVRQTLRAIAPTVPAVAAMLAIRAAESGDRTLGLAFAELGVYAAVTVAATAVFERSLIREVVGYLRGRGRPIAEPASA